MFATIIAAAFLAGTFLQMKTSLADFGVARRDAMDWWNTEDELVDDESRWRPLKRWHARRLVRQLRTPEIHREISHATRVLLGWVILFTASALALINAIVELC